MNFRPNIAGRYKVIFRSLKYSNYRLFFSGQSISLIGTWMQRIAMPWMVYNMTESVLLLGIVSFAGQIPSVLLAPVAGVFTDRWNRYRVLLAAQILLMVQASILAWLSLSGNIQVWHIIALSIFLGCIGSFDVPARQSFVIDMVEKKEDLGNAIALNSLMFNGARLIGPSVAGMILVSAGEGICFLLNALSYVFVIISLMMMKIKPKKVGYRKPQLFREILVGIEYTFGFAPIKHIIILLGLVSFMGMSYSVLMPVFAKEVLHGASNTYGFLMGASGMGALMGALFLASRESVLRLGRIIPFASILFGSGLVLLSFTRYFPLALGLMIFIGLGMMLQAAASNTIIQTITDDDKRGRVMSFYTIAVMGTAPFGSLLAGSLAKVIGTPATIFTAGIVTISGGLVFLRKLPALKELVRPIYVKMGVIPEVAAGIQTASEPESDKVIL